MLIRRGVLRRTGRDIALQRISDVSFTQTLWDRMVGAGTLTIESAGENGQENLTNVPRSDQQQQLINRLIEEDGGRRADEGQPAQGPAQGPAAGYSAGSRGSHAARAAATRRRSPIRRSNQPLRKAKGSPSEEESRSVSSLGISGCHGVIQAAECDR